MKKYVPAVFTAPAVVNFFSNNPEKETGLDFQIKQIKQKHNKLCHRYFLILKESRLSRIHLNQIHAEYQKLLLSVNDLALLYKNTSHISSVREVSEVIEETMFAIWKYIYDHRLYTMH